MAKSKLEKHINKFLTSYLELSDDFKKLDDVDKLYVYSVLRKLLKLIYQVIKYPNVYPILLVQTVTSKKIITTAFEQIEDIIPNLKNIRIEVVN